MISLIVAMGKNRVIGLDNKMPWHLPADLAYFKKVTTGHPIIMGRKTYESIGRPLPNRKNIILTRDKSFSVEGCHVIHSVEEALRFEDDVFIIGGAEVYKQFLSYADRLYITEIDEEFDGDTFFPEVNSDWKAVRVEPGIKDEKNPYNYRFAIYEKMSNS